MRFLLLGADGQVGFELMRSLMPLGEIIAATRSGVTAGQIPCLQVNLAAPETIVAAVQATRPDWVVNAAAWTAVDAAEDSPEQAQQVNGAAVATLAAAALRCGARVLHFSTDYVFSGASDRLLGEDDPTEPVSVYGRSKLEGERALQGSGTAFLLFRIAWVYAARGRNFLRTMLRLAEQRETLRVVNDQYGCPTPARFVADACATALMQHRRAPVADRARFEGVFHLALDGHTTWHGFASALLSRAHRAGLISRLPRLLPIASADYPTRARRPRWSVLDTRRARETFLFCPPDWQHGLDGVIGEMATSREHRDE